MGEWSSFVEKLIHMATQNSESSVFASIRYEMDNNISLDYMSVCSGVNKPHDTLGTRMTVEDSGRCALMRCLMCPCIVDFANRLYFYACSRCVVNQEQVC